MSYTLPAEWQPQSAIQLTWPHANTDWHPWLAEIETTYLEIVKAIVQFQHLVIACHDTNVQQHVIQMLSNSQIGMDNVHLFIAPCNDTWARDHGPITLINEQGDTKLLDFTFNAWGAKYQANDDDKITFNLIQQPFVHLQDYHKVDLVLEGGSIESDGQGTLLTTEICLLNENRNPTLSKSQIDEALKAWLGMSNIIWLQDGYLPGDDTDAHIDTLARFTPRGIAYVTNEDTKATNYAALKKMEQQLISAKNAKGQPYQLFPLPSPAPITNRHHEPLPATYANFLVINNAVLAPVYQDDNDDLALSILQQAFPEHQIIAIDCRTVIEQFGSLHCLTMQLPKGLIS